MEITRAVNRGCVSYDGFVLINVVRVSKFALVAGLISDPSYDCSVNLILTGNLVSRLKFYYRRINVRQLNWQRESVVLLSAQLTCSSKYPEYFVKVDARNFRLK